VADCCTYGEGNLREAWLLGHAAGRETLAEVESLLALLKRYAGQVAANAPFEGPKD
jgi:hypothetical protein